MDNLLSRLWCFQTGSPGRVIILNPPCEREVNRFYSSVADKNVITHQYRKKELHIQRNLILLVMDGTEVGGSPFRHIAH